MEDMEKNEGRREGEEGEGKKKERKRVSEGGRRGESATRRDKF